MNSILLLTAWITFPILFWIVAFSSKHRLGRIAVGLLCLAAMLLGVILLANYVWAIDAQLLAEIDKYDTGTPERERASRAWASDVDRSMTLLLSPVITAIWYGIVFLLLFVIRRVARTLIPVTAAVGSLPPIARS